MLIKKKLRDWCIGIASIAIMMQSTAAQQIVTANAPDAKASAGSVIDQDASQTQYLIILVDRSSSTGQLSPSETQRAVIKHSIDTAGLAMQPVHLLIICYGGDGVQVFGENGQPTVAYESLLKQVLDKWPAASGGTPMDETYETLLEIVRDLPDDARTTVVQMTDGIPDSMRLRPETFQAVRDSIALKREAVLKKADGFPANVQQELLRLFEQPLLDSRTKEWQSLYDQQLPLELQRTLDLAVALKKEHIRFVTVDFINSPQLAEIHATAGGVPEDLIVTSPNDIISKLHERKITALPRLVQMPTLVLEADAQAFERETEIPLEKIAEAAQVVIELQPAIPDFFLNSTLKAEYAGRTFDFNPDAGAGETSVALDGDGGVATLTLKLDDLRPDETVKLSWESLNGNMTAPRCSIYTFLRMKESLKADFRPTFVPVDVHAPFKLSSSNKVAFSFGLQNVDATDIVKVSTVEAVFRNKRGLGQPVRVSMTPDSKHPERVVSDEMKLEGGSYDVHLHVRLPSGIDLELTLRGHFDVSLRNEAITVELPFGNEVD
ncbi:MAG TPA: hypothetical protein PK992_12035, partial [Planctomycetaceae bacterium]|nr:hypothetical protein [Planctomycetaceae bacterium]